MNIRVVRSTTGFTFLSGMLLCAPAASAQWQPQRPDSVPEYVIEAVNVTVTRAETRRDAEPRRIDVITRTDLERTVGEELPDILKKQAAVDVVQYPGLLSGVGIRGFRPQFTGINQRTLILIDGRPAGVTNLSLLSLQDVERIEVLKGPAATLYGSNAMGGAVNIITRRSQGRLRSSGFVGYGTWNTRQRELTTGGALGRSFDFDLGYSSFERGNDYRIGDGSFFRDRLGEGTVTRIQPDGSTTELNDPGSGEVLPFTEYGTRTRSLRVGYRFNDQWRLNVRGERFAADRVQNPGDITAPWDDRSLKNVARRSDEIGLSGALGQHSLLLRLFRSGEDAEYFDQPDASTEQPRFISLRTPIRWRGAQLQDVIRFGSHSLTAGFDYSAARAESERFASPATPAPPYSPDSETISRAGFAEGRLAFLDERLVATLGGRWDRITFAVEDAEVFGGTRVTANQERYTVFNPSYGLQYRTTGGLRVHGTAGRAFVAPDAFFVAGRAEQPAFGQPGVTLTVGNPELRPENSFTWDAGVGLLRPRSGIDADVTYFRTDVRDRITSQRTVPAQPQLTPMGDTIRAVTTYINADEAEIRGVEGRLSYDFGAAVGYRYSFRLFGNATRILHAEEVLGGAAREIQNVADLTVNYGVEWDDRRRFSTRLTGRYVGERADTDWSDWMNPAELRYPPFMTIDLATQVRFGNHYRLGLLVSNLTDEHYYEIRGYPLPGRSAQLRLSVNF